MTPDLSTSYLGLKLEHPVVASASPLSYTLDGIRELEDAGAAAVVMYSLFEEQIEQESHALHHYLEYGTHSYAEALDYFPEPQEFNVGPDQYLELIRRGKEAVRIPLVGSLNGVSPGGWTEYARLMEEAGADALELNLYYLPTDPGMTGLEVEEMYLDVVRDVSQSISIPIAVKVGPYFSNFTHMAARFVQAGASGLVLFNRFYQPDLDLDRLEITPNLVLSRADELRLPLTWVAILYGRIQADLAITTGVHSHLEVLKGMMAGARVAMMASELLKNGVERIGETVQELQTWMLEHEYESIQQMQGSMSQIHVANPDAFERGNYMKVLRSWRPDPTGMLIR
ncbi:dihydroorotate dehydrogenase-like protein [uncultured Meiothermus sp.]|jgi:dihydroorotate dehydrogenase (fumarate)|uniref:dihydroorotate dehydrogenase-like protein n=1 Tax=uncultured Meiothermus sp. TaxID=157471 RepID=UPI0026123BB9|nr:dihydroorotate dehydrogenase-like protein [uncultured Meiothermus sp.]